MVVVDVETGGAAQVPQGPQFNYLTVFIQGLGNWWSVFFVLFFFCEFVVIGENGL